MRHVPRDWCRVLGASAMLTLAALTGACRTIAILALSFSLAITVVAVGQVWAGLIETLRLGSGHLSYRAARIPWMHHRPLTLALAFAVGVALALLAPLTVRPWAPPIDTISHRTHP